MREKKPEAKNQADEPAQKQPTLALCQRRKWGSISREQGLSNNYSCLIEIS